MIRSENPDTQDYSKLFLIVLMSSIESNLFYFECIKENLIDSKNHKRFKLSLNILETESIETSSVGIKFSYLFSLNATCLSTLQSVC